jgi:hypothetical protein
MLLSACVDHAVLPQPPEIDGSVSHDGALSRDAASAAAPQCVAGDWKTDDQAPSSDVLEPFAIATDGEVAHALIAFQDGIHYRRYEGTATIADELVASFPCCAFDPAVVVDGQGAIHATYSHHTQDGKHVLLGHAVRRNAVWSVEDLALPLEARDWSGGYYRLSALAVDYTGDVHVAVLSADRTAIEELDLSTGQLHMWRDTAWPPRDGPPVYITGDSRPMLIMGGLELIADDRLRLSLRDELGGYRQLHRALDGDWQEDVVEGLPFPADLQPISRGDDGSIRFAFSPWPEQPTTFLYAFSTYDGQWGLSSDAPDTGTEPLVAVEGFVSAHGRDHVAVLSLPITSSLQTPWSTLHYASRDGAGAWRSEPLGKIGGTAAMGVTMSGAVHILADSPDPEKDAVVRHFYRCP